MGYFAVIENGKVVNLVKADNADSLDPSSTASWEEYFSPKIGQSFSNGRFISEEEPNA